MLHPTGKVILVGAGPGDPELLTIKAARWLQRADVVITDRLVSEDILRDHVRPDAEVIFAGKQAGKCASVPQSRTNELLVQQARQGRLVVRLKGGDVSVFSNVLDELNTLVQHGIPYEIVPGITAALGAAAYAGIPLTARHHATAVRLLTCYQPAMIQDRYWRELATTEDTLVFYMSGEQLPLIVEKLRRYGISADKQLALIEQATTPHQRITTAGLYDDLDVHFPQEPASPSLLMIGRVVGLHQQFAWLTTTMEGEYFQPVAAPLFPIEESPEQQLQTA